MEPARMSDATIEGCVEPLRILLVDDSREFLDSAIRYLRAQPLITVVGCATSGYEGIDKVLRVRPDVVLMDITLPDLNGLKAIWQIRMQIDVDPTIIVMTLHDSYEYREAAKQVGADGFLTKSEFITQVIPLIFSLCTRFPS